MLHTVETENSNNRPDVKPATKHGSNFNRSS